MTLVDLSTVVVPAVTVITVVLTLMMKKRHTFEALLYNVPVASSTIILKI